MSNLKEGQKAPPFEGTDQDGRLIKLSNYTGKKLILYFYPKDDTPGCTKEACNLRDNISELRNQGFEIIGISPDTVKSHKGFAEKYSLPFPLIADTGKEIMNTYGTYGEKMMYGKPVTGVLRTTFIINEKGIIEKIIRKVDTANHTEQILKTINK